MNTHDVPRLGGRIKIMEALCHFDSFDRLCITAGEIFNSETCRTVDFSAYAFEMTSGHGLSVEREGLGGMKEGLGH